MKNLMILLISFLAVSTAAQAQEKLTAKGGDDIDNKDVKQYLEAKMDMEYRINTIKFLELNNEEIEEFDPLFKDYMDERDELTEEKQELLEGIREEMKEDDDEDNQMEDLTDFIEEYWEVEIDEMKAREEFFDKLENKIPKKKAIQYFIWEDMVQSAMERDMQIAYFPNIVTLQLDTFLTKRSASSIYVDEVDRMNKEMNARRAVRNYHSWVSNMSRGMTISHEFSSTALKKLARAISAIKEEKGFDIPSFEANKQKVMDKANALRTNTNGDQHADIIKEAFMTITEMINSVAYKASVQPNNQLVLLSKQIDENKFLMEQAETVYDFFDEANNFISPMVKAKAMKK